MAILGLQLVVLVLLVVANGFFAAAEIAVVSARRGRLEPRAAEDRHGATAAIALQDEPNRFHVTGQVGISLIGSFAAAFGGAVFVEPLVRSFTPLVGAAGSAVAPDG